MNVEAMRLVFIKDAKKLNSSNIQKLKNESKFVKKSKWFLNKMK